MATFKSFRSPRILAVAVLFGSVISLGAAFAPLETSFQVSSDLAHWSASEALRSILIPFEAPLSMRPNAALDRLGEMIFTHHAIAVSA